MRSHQLRWRSWSTHQQYVLFLIRKFFQYPPVLYPYLLQYRVKGSIWLIVHRVRSLPHIFWPQPGDEGYKVHRFYGAWFYGHRPPFQRPAESVLCRRVLIWVSTNEEVPCIPLLSASFPGPGSDYI